ncbi:hypothetical protein QTO34_017017 [Cnephaeus nilssonii]|uniref:Uncharacterized protein n=1 Tax=Cnephaeus nilssonii TaxID=3371016 RepID=A0AA40H9W2_CNENI|nr:hypothetical protein QTO34_017017 [Eptesicus nilssonii]
MFAPIGDWCSGARSSSVFAVVAESQVSNKILLSLQDGEAPAFPQPDPPEPSGLGAGAAQVLPPRSQRPEWM